MITYKSKSSGIRYHAVFVYGTLKKGNARHHLLEGSPGETAEASGFDLFNGPDYPIAVPGTGELHGEVYIVPDIVLRRVDREEDYPKLFSRKTVAVTKADGSTVNAWIYYRDEPGDGEYIPSGTWNPDSGETS